MRHIIRDGYHAFDWPERRDLFLYQLWRTFPSLVVGRYLVNTSFDSGVLCLGDEEKAAGWQMMGEFAHSPVIQQPHGIPHDQFDEWLAFDAPTSVSAFETMVNFTGFSPVAFDWEEKWEQFRAQVRELNPLHVMGENFACYVVTRDAGLANQIKEAEPVATANPDRRQMNSKGPLELSRHQPGG